MDATSRDRPWILIVALVWIAGSGLVGCGATTPHPSPPPSLLPSATAAPTPSAPPPTPTATPSPFPTVPLPPAVLRMNLGGEPDTLDPHRATEAPAQAVVEQLFLGLTAYDPRTALVVPELALSWEASEAGRVWTFHLRDDVHWVRYDPDADAVLPLRPVTADDVVYGLRRALRPENDAWGASLLYPIRNAEQIHTTAPTETYAIEELGVQAIDETTVRFELEAPAAYFPSLMATTVARPLPPEAIEEQGSQWAGPGTIWTNAVYALRAWVPGDYMTLVRNPHHPHAEGVQIDTVELSLIADPAFVFAMYHNDELDTAPAPANELARLQADPVQSNELTIALQACVEYYGFNTTRPPFDDARVRRAFSLAIDRRRLIDDQLHGLALPADVLAPPMVLGSPAGDPQVGVSFDPQQAREELLQAGYPGGEGFPPIVLLVNEEQERQAMALQIQRMWQQELGVEVVVETLPWERYLAAIAPDAPEEEVPHIWRMGWCGRYPDEQAWLHAVLHPLQGTNRPRLRLDDPTQGPLVEEFTALLDRAAGELDPTQRSALYRQAEQLAIYEIAALAPLYYEAQAGVAKPYLERNYPPYGGPDIHNWRVDPH